MATTAVFAEMLVAGIEAMVWIALIAMAIVGKKASTCLVGPLKDWSVPITTLALAFSYGIGIVIDRVGDSLFDWLFREAKKCTCEQCTCEDCTADRKKPEETFARLRLQLLAREDKITDFLEYIRTRIRVARSTCLNLALTTTVMPVFLIRCTCVPPCQIVMIELGLAGLTWMAAFAAVRINRTYDNRLRQAVAMKVSRERDS